MLEVLAWISFVLVLGSFVPYSLSILRGEAKPERASWFIWTILGSIFVASQLAEGGEESVLFTVAGTIGPLIIFLLSIKNGVGGFERRDKAALIFAAVGLLLWYLTDNASLALWIALAIDASGVALTIRKTYYDPKSELPLFWAIGIVSGSLAAISVGELDIDLLAFPVYVTINNAIIFYLSLRKPQD